MCASACVVRPQIHSQHQTLSHTVRAASIHKNVALKTMRVAIRVEIFVLRAWIMLVLAKKARKYRLEKGSSRQRQLRLQHIIWGWRVLTDWKDLKMQQRICSIEHIREKEQV